MANSDITALRKLTSFPALVDYLRDELDWPIETEDADDIAFEYEPEELDIEPSYAVKIKGIKQIRPLVDGQPWGVFFIEFESKRLPVVVLRRILQKFVATSRSRDPGRPVWALDDLLFISALGEANNRGISFAHFRQSDGAQPELRTFSWDSREIHFYYLQNFNLEQLRWPADHRPNPVVWREQWRQAFPTPHHYVIRKSQELAREMAHHAAVVRALVAEVYRLEVSDGPLHQLYDSFKEVLLHDLTPATFADMVAQTVTYGLFSAATQSPQELSYDHLVELIPNTNPFLKELLAELTGRGGLNMEELGVDQLVNLLRRTDMTAIVQDFGRQSGAGREDPVVHFYELFLNEYDKDQKVQRGVFYTPDPVVSYIVRSVDYLLRAEFGLKDGLADTTLNPDTGQPWVQILDPATGTGTFLAHVIDQIEQTVKAKPGADWNDYVAHHLLPRLNGFELLMAPYAVAHMKLGLKLKQTGYNFAGNERLRIYLSNALEEPVERHETLAMTGFLSKESNEAARVKRRMPVTVVLGNPPYSNFGMMNRNDWILGLLEEYKRDLNEKKLNLDDDFIKFLIFGQSRIKETGQGILAFITNNSFISGITHRRMRQSLMEAFSDIYILDLHGSSKKQERSPDGSKDENVFDIQQGVAICIFVKKQKLNEISAVHHADLWGSQAKKYDELLKSSAKLTKWSFLEPEAEYFFFIPKNFEVGNEYSPEWSLLNIFQVQQNGLKTDRDDLFFDFDREELKRRMETFYSDEGLAPAFRKTYRIKSSSSYDLISRRQSTSYEETFIHSCLYRPFDRRFLYYAVGLTSRPAWKIMSHMLAGSNLGLICLRQTRRGEEGTFLVGKGLINKDAVSLFDIATIFPLYLYTTPETTRGTLFATQETSREPNLAPAFIRDITARLGLKFIKDGLGDLTTSLGPEDIFHYAYAVFHSPTYRSRYAEFLKIDFPRLPLTTNLSLFRHLCQFGADLVALHLLEDDYPAASWNRAIHDSSFIIHHSPFASPAATFVERQTGTTVGSMSKSSAYDKGRVYLDTSNRARSSYFEGVPEEVWNFHIGGYQVCHKWLYDRRGSGGEPGRTLNPEDIEHYRRVVVALKETMRLMAEIDAVIEDHGGWPLVGSVGDK